MVLILGALACLGPMSIDAYLPAFGAIGRDFRLPAEVVHLTLGMYMVAYAFMTLMHGTLSDSFGRRRVILTSLLVYAAGSVIAAIGLDFNWLLTGRVLQGLSAGAGMVVGQAIVNDCYEGATAQKTMSYIIMVFGVSPAFAPIIGGYVASHSGWRGIFVMLAILAALSAALCAWRLPETLPPARRQRFAVRVLLRNYGRVLKDRQFVAMAIAFGTLFAGFAFLIGAAPDFVTQVLRLPETAFAYLFIPLVVGMMSGSFLAARMASRWSASGMIGLAYAMMGLSCLINVTYTALADVPSVPWAVVPLGLFSFGLSIAIPSMTLRILRRIPELAGTAASVLGFIQMVFFSAVSGWFVPLVYGSALKLAVALAAGVVVSGAAWCVLGWWFREREVAAPAAG
ncbi:MFS transporter [Pigmentiphaga litoralis]|uniref:multidrug effflux MFS transporter n=1 Tax=Pigmentiphaga litoralis TaxID=516702 RepID=UPI00167A0992|nr:multidrug effflux MFS transporter [Pigmentiphaga litoralis]GGX22437.1 MFS transporter [Pigmentiphaga litoralis]